MITVTIDVCEAKEFLTKAGSEGRRHLLGLGSWARDLVRQGLEALLNAELEVLLERERSEGTEELPNWRNGYRRRTLSILGLGRLAFRVPRDRKGHYRSELIPFRKRRTVALEEMAAIPRMALSVGFRSFGFPPVCDSSYRAPDSCPGGTVSR